MRGWIGSRAGLVALYLAATAALVGAVWWTTYTATLAQVSARARADLTLAADLLTVQLQRFGALSVFLSDDPEIATLVAGQGDPAAMDARLRHIADMTGSIDLVVLDRAGRVLSAASGQAAATVPHAGTAYFTRALDGALGSGHTYANTVGRPGVVGGRAFTYAHPVFAPEGPVAGVVVVVADVEAIEAEWRADPSAVFFTDDTGVVFVSNRSELVLKTQGEPGSAARYGGAAPVPFFERREKQVGGHVIWELDGGPYLPKQALHLQTDVPRINMTGQVLQDVAPAQRIAWLQALSAGAVLLVLGAVLVVAVDRRRALAERLEIEARANAALEARVAARTRELSEVNADLRREIGEREEAEKRLKRAQADLVQAGKLSALGQMSAGISHELNQPLMAIRSFAENGAELLARGKTEAAGENLGRISELARRMGRIIKNLRAFARQETEPTRDIDIVGVVEAVLDMSGGRIRNADVALEWTPPPAPVLVRGGEVRLQQVVLNLVSNAIDAMEGQADKALCVAITRNGAQVRVSVADTGPGIAEPEKIFDPFYSTKEVGQSEGMGLGLSISYGLVQSFGGAIRGENRPEGGAIFVVELGAANVEQAA